MQEFLDDLTVDFGDAVRQLDDRAQRMRQPSTRLLKKFHKNLAVVDSWYGRLGPLGREFAALAAKVVPKRSLNPNLHGAAYTPYAHRIEFDAEAAADAGQLFSYQNHEMMHAANYLAGAIPISVPMDYAVNIIVCPRHYVWANELDEGRAYAVQAYLEWMAEKMIPELAGRLNSVECSAKAYFDDGQSRNYPVNTVITALTVAFMSDVTLQPGLSLRDTYNGEAMRKWSFRTAGLKKHYETYGVEAPQFVRIDHQDVIAIGALFGPNPFAQDDGTLFPYFSEPQKMAKDNEAELARLHKLHGIGDDRQLPTLTEALAARNIDRREYARLNGVTLSAKIS